jgi:flagellar biosynthesis protein FlhG
MVRTLAFSSGKGGVGKTSISVNCALLLSMQGHRVALLDADFGMANSHIMLDQKIDKTLQDVLENKASIQDIVCETSNGLKLIPGGSGVIELLNLNSTKRWEIIRSVSSLKDELDYLIVDTPAGGADASIEFAAACDSLIVVLVGEPTSFMDAYAFIKAICLEKEYDKISILVNLAASEKSALKSFDSFKQIVTKFLDVELSFAGWLPDSRTLKNSIISRKPVALNSKGEDRLLIQNLNKITKHISSIGIQSTSGIKFFGE